MIWEETELLISFCDSIKSVLLTNDVSRGILLKVDVHQLHIG